MTPFPRLAMSIACVVLFAPHSSAQNRNAVNPPITITYPTVPSLKNKAAFICGNKVPCGDQQMTFYDPLIAVTGEPVTGELGYFRICHGIGVIQAGGFIYWGDGETSTSPVQVVGPFWQGRFTGQHTYLSSGEFQVFGWFGAQCYYQQVPHGREECSCGSVTAKVYENIPIKSFTLSSPAVKGGSSLTGTVFLAEKAKKLGGYVRPFATDPVYPVPHIIVTAGLDTGTFAISTTGVSAPVIVPVSVYAGGVTMTVPLTINP